ncbi:hypothetical protein AVDCRST_MAG92-5491 [uncultured Coleofasciculus sp.]|uniref:Uncharacterized protein n=1 Tax=uncultured Coleofasciculus sp. TaxID=1267456 RepID=A0A6J4KGZ5_9CYAN|nr:hypothetical protein AVDCRST_MAG92-5491 [uncultured Coleofasciculus sp.]
MTSNTTTDIQMQSWVQAFADKSENSFADAFAHNVTLEASVLVRPIEGRDCVKSVMATASQVYEALTFNRPGSPIWSDNFSSRLRYRLNAA